MSELIELDSRYSTTRRVRKDAPEVIEAELKAKYKAQDQFETIIFQTEGEERKREGGLRTKGYFKKSSEEKPIITVITVVFNGQKYLDETILSVINQTYDNVEYIIIDGGSTDNTLEIIKKYEHAIDYWVSEKDRGIYDAMNKGIDLAMGEWINFMNADDYIYNESILSSISFKNANFVYGNILLRDGNYLFRSGKPVDLNLLAFSGIFHHQAVFAKKNLYISLGKFREDFKISSDYDFFVKVLKRNIETEYLNMDIAVMRVGGISSEEVSKSLNEKLLVIKGNYSFKTYVKAWMYQYFYERPRNYCRIFLKKRDLIKYWRVIRDR